MNKLSKAKRDQLILVALLTAGVIAGLWYAVVNSQNSKLEALSQKAVQTSDKLAKAEALKKQSKDILATLDQRSNELLRRESGMAPTRDSYGWMLKNIKPFIVAHSGINVVNFNVPDFVDASILPKFAYKTAVAQVKAIAYYHDFGKFLADFENKFPYFRIQGMEVTPSTEGEKLSFKFDIVVLVRPADSDADKQ